MRDYSNMVTSIMSNLKDMVKVNNVNKIEMLWKIYSDNEYKVKLKPEY